MSSRIPMPSARQTGPTLSQPGNRHSSYGDKNLPPTPRTPASLKFPTLAKPQQAVSKLPMPRSPRLPAVPGYPMVVPSPTVLASGFPTPQPLPSRRPRVSKRISTEAVPVQPRDKASGATNGEGIRHPSRAKIVTVTQLQTPHAPASMQTPKAIPHTRMPKAMPTGSLSNLGKGDVSSFAAPAPPPATNTPRFIPEPDKIPAPTPKMNFHASPRALAADLDRLQDRIESKLNLLCSPKQAQTPETTGFSAFASPAMTQAASQAESQGRLSRSNSVFSISLYDYDSDEGQSMRRTPSRTSLMSREDSEGGSSVAGRVRRSARVNHDAGSAYMSRRQSRQSNASIPAIEEEVSSDDRTPCLEQASRLSVDVEQAINQLRQHVDDSPDLGGYFSPESVYSDNGSDDSHNMMTPADWLASLKRNAETVEDTGGDRRGRIWGAGGNLLPLQSLPTPGAEKGFDFGQ